MNYKLTTPDDYVNRYTTLHKLFSDIKTKTNEVLNILNEIERIENEIASRTKKIDELRQDIKDNSGEIKKLRKENTQQRHERRKQINQHRVIRKECLKLLTNFKNQSKLFSRNAKYSFYSQLSNFISSCQYILDYSSGNRKKELSEYEAEFNITYNLIPHPNSVKGGDILDLPKFEYKQVKETYKERYFLIKRAVKLTKNPTKDHFIKAKHIIEDLLPAHDISIWFDEEKYKILKETESLVIACFSKWYIKGVTYADYEQAHQTTEKSFSKWHKPSRFAPKDWLKKELLNQK